MTIRPFGQGSYPLSWNNAKQNVRTPSSLINGTQVQQQGVGNEGGNTGVVRQQGNEGGGGSEGHE